MEDVKKSRSDVGHIGFCLGSQDLQHDFSSILTTLRQTSTSPLRNILPELDALTEAQCNAKR